MSDKEPNETTAPENETAVPEQRDPWRHRSMMMKCRTCMSFVIKEKERPHPPNILALRLGRCRRHAPTMAGFPAVFESDWCGDHKLDENRL